MTINCTFCKKEVDEYVVGVAICDECLGKLMKFVIRVSDFLGKQK